MTTPNPTPKRPRGRPKGTGKPEEEKLNIDYKLKLNNHLEAQLKKQAEKHQISGAEWLRRQIEKASP